MVVEKQEKTTREFLKHIFTDAEMQVMHKDLAQKTIELRHLQSDKATVMKQYASSIEKAQAEIEILADKLNSGFENQAMNCPVYIDWEKDIKQVVHPETGEIVKTLDVTPDDRQTKADLEAQSNG